MNTTCQKLQVNLKPPPARHADLHVSNCPPGEVPEQNRRPQRVTFQKPLGLAESIEAYLDFFQRGKPLLNGIIDDRQKRFDLGLGIYDLHNYREITR